MAGFLKETKERVFDPFGITVSPLHLEKESIAYNACQLELNHRKVLFRSAKITPTKVGHFVTVWKRNHAGITAPFDASDAIDLVIVNTRKGEDFGQFVFPAAVLAQKGILSTAVKEGKRAFRVYPPWEKELNKQALKTQQWQLEYFLEIPLNKAIDAVRMKQLYCL
ncbi:hypothetical protein E4635_02280 [Flavobacterium humi]|uniref:MepB family protein n=2 Tax=Flavobacterium humi TaxID=2562683 RepID=A0A4Z0LDI5_9FLAO|nr:hypothetical protein E4635_02280 [Flavobacterium humi]